MTVTELARKIARQMNAEILAYLRAIEAREQLIVEVRAALSRFRDAGGDIVGAVSVKENKGGDVTITVKMPKMVTPPWFVSDTVKRIQEGEERILKELGFTKELVKPADEKS